MTRIGINQSIESIESIAETCAKDKSVIGVQIGKVLVTDLRPLVGRHGVGAESLALALEEALEEICKHDTDKDWSGEELRSWLLGLILCKIFVKGGELWISPRTEAGRSVTPDLLVSAYAMWERAVNLATRFGVDPAAAAETLAKATHATADRLAASAACGDDRDVRDAHKYLFATYMHLIFGIARKQGSARSDYVDMGDWIANRQISDRGAFLEAVENGIFCREFLDALPPRGRSVAIARYILGYSWQETAAALGSSINAAQKALSAGVRKAIGTCVRELRRPDRPKSVDAKTLKNKNKRSGGWR